MSVKGFAAFAVFYIIVDGISGQTIFSSILLTQQIINK